MNNQLSHLQPYPFEKLKLLFENICPNKNFSPISLGIGEPKHSTPSLIKDAIVSNLSDLEYYPITSGSISIRSSICSWLERRYELPKLDPSIHVLPLNGSREGLFSITQTLVGHKENSIVVCPNPFYQIYEGAAIMAGAKTYFINSNTKEEFTKNLQNITKKIWESVEILFICSPSNPTGIVTDLKTWDIIFSLSEKYQFTVISDECYSEIYFDDKKPLGALQAANFMGRDFDRLVIFTSLSKRSNVPGMRSAFVAGDPQIIKKFLLYRTYHGSAMNPCIQKASIAAWNDELHVKENREKYVKKFNRVIPVLSDVLTVNMPEASFYLWAKVNKLIDISDTEFAKYLYEEYNVTVLPGSFIARKINGINPGKNFIRMALVADEEECLEAADRIVKFIKKFKKEKNYG